MYYHEARVPSTSRRSSLTRRMFILSWITFIISIICIVLGIVSVSLSKSQADFPFSAGGAMVAGIPALLLSCCPMYLYCEDTQSSVTSGCADCCIILMVVWFSITILAVCFAFGVAGVYALDVCANELRMCSSDSGAKLAISWLAIIATIILFILSLAIFFTCCCNASKFGMPLLNDYSADYSYNTSDREQIRQMRRQRDLYSIERSREMRRQQNIASQTASVDHDSSQMESTNNISSISAYINDTEIGTIDETGPTSADFPSIGGNRYTDPPPSYEEVMKKETTSETAI